MQDYFNSRGNWNREKLSTIGRSTGLCHGTRLESGRPDQADGEHHLHHLQRHQVALHDHRNKIVLVITFSNIDVDQKE